MLDAPCRRAQAEPVVWGLVARVTSVACLSFALAPCIVHQFFVALRLPCAGGASSLEPLHIETAMCHAPAWCIIRTWVKSTRLR